MLNQDTADSLRMVKTSGVWSVCEGAFHGKAFRLANNTKRSNMKNHVGAPMVILALAPPPPPPAADAADAADADAADAAAAEPTARKREREGQEEVLVDLQLLSQLVEEGEQSSAVFAGVGPPLPHSAAAEADPAAAAADPAALIGPTGSGVGSAFADSMGPVLAPRVAALDSRAPLQVGAALCLSVRLPLRRVRQGLRVDR